MERVRGLEPLQDGLKSVIRTPCSAFALWVSIFDSHFRTSNLDAPPMPSRAQHKYDERSTMCLRKIKHSVFVSDEACGAYTLSMYDRYHSFPACPLFIDWHPIHTYPCNCLTQALSFACSACMVFAAVRTRYHEWVPCMRKAPTHSPQTEHGPSMHPL